jgi:6-pyruvoyl-tetrahydropterin synthase
MMPMEKEHEKRTFEEWEKLYHNPKEAEAKKLMTEEEYKKYKYRQLVKGRLAKARNVFLSAIAKSAPVVKNVGKNAAKALEDNKP